MAVPINNVTRRVVYAASGTGPYNFTFEILAAGDIAVFKDDALLTLTTDYTVTINANGTGSITLVASPTGATQIAIVGNRTIQRTTDFVTGGDFFANTLNDELDQQTIFAQQNAEGLGRTLTAPQTDPTTINMTLPRATLRANKTLAFDANGNPSLGDTLGTNRGNWAAGVLYFVRDIIKDTSTNNIFQVLVQHTSVGAQPLTTNAESAKYFLLVDAASATTSATNAAASASAAATSASNASTSASNASTSATTATTQATNAASSATSANTAKVAAEAARDSALAAYDNFDDRYLGPYASNPTVDNDGNTLLAGALYFNTVVPEMRLWTGSAWVAAYVSGTGLLASANNLSDVASTSTARTNLGLGTGDSPQFTAINVGNATDTTVTRVSAGVIAVEGSNVLLASNIGTSVQAYDVDTAKTDVVQTFTENQTFNSTRLKLAGSTSGSATLNAPAIAGTNTYTLPSDASTLGYLNIPQSGSDKTTSYTLATTDIGEFVGVGTSGSITIPNSTFVAGDVVSIFNNTTGNITITCTITTAYIAGTNTDRATVTLATRGVATVLFISGTVCVITGNVS